MNFNRRSFFKLIGVAALTRHAKASPKTTCSAKPLAIATWAPNLAACKKAYDEMQNGKSGLDAIEAGIHIPEADPNDTSVGFGGFPDRDGRVTLDACIMDHLGNTGAVLCLEHIKHPISVARLVMEKTPHVILSGNGALSFALAQGFKKENLLTASSEKAWIKWLETANYKPSDTIDALEKRAAPVLQKQDLPLWPIPEANHDTIGLLCMDANGNISGGCSTSGMAFKMNGRIGDSPIIGAGLFVDNEVGAATCSGLGEEIIKVCGSHTVVEMMRQGAHPEEACKEAVKRIAYHQRNRKTPIQGLQAGFIALDKQGRYGAFSLYKNFSYAIKSNVNESVIDSKFYFNL